VSTLPGPGPCSQGSWGGSYWEATKRRRAEEAAREDPLVAAAATPSACCPLTLSLLHAPADVCAVLAPHRARPSSRAAAPLGCSLTRRSSACSAPWTRAATAARASRPRATRSARRCARLPSARARELSRARVPSRRLAFRAFGLVLCFPAECWRGKHNPHACFTPRSHALWCGAPHAMIRTPTPFILTHSATRRGRKSQFVHRRRRTLLRLPCHGMLQPAIKCSPTSAVMPACPWHAAPPPIQIE
jgi:hypothetical protein